MFVRRLSYEAVHDGENPRRFVSFSIASGGRVGTVAALTAVTVTFLGLAALGIYGEIYGNREANSAADGATAGIAGWQDEQPVAGETLTAFSENLVSPENRWSKDGELRTTLRVAPMVAQAAPLAPPLNVRAYEGSVPGPTLRIKPGDRLVVTLVNDLGLPGGDPLVAEEAGVGWDSRGSSGSWDSLEGKVEAWPNVTNIHVHGLHVSPSGVGDNIYRRAGPGDTLEYAYDIPADHYPGIFYYHPHFEGSSSVQTLGGMSGAIVVEDPEGSLPPEVESMREVIAVLQETNIESGSLRNYKVASEISGSRMPLYGHPRGGDVDSVEGEEGEGGEERGGNILHFVTINGQYQPVIRAQPGEAFRLRIVHGGNNDHMHVSLLPTAADAVTSWDAEGTEGDQDGGQKEKEHENDRAGEGPGSSGGGCTLLTLARDGVYLPAPRRQGGGNGRLVLAPGSRADVAVRCDRPGVYRFVSSKGVHAGVDGGDSESIMAYLGQKTDVFEGTLAFVDVGGEEMDMRLPTESPSTLGASRLLQDLQDLPDTEVSRFLFEFNAADKISRLNQTYTWYGVNGVQYNNASQVMRRVLIDSVEEWVIVNQRTGRGEGAEDCRRPRQAPLPAHEMGKGSESGADSSSDALGGDTGDGSRRIQALQDEAGGRRHGRGEGITRKRRGLGQQPPEGSDGNIAGGFEHMGEEEGESDGRGLGRTACDRAGPGKVTADGHPFHLHVNHFQVVESSWGDKGPDWNVGDWRDTISIPAPGNVTIRWRADDFTGEAVAHCHIFGHSDTGMMMNFEIFEEP